MINNIFVFVNLIIFIMFTKYDLNHGSKFAIITDIIGYLLSLVATVWIIYDVSGEYL